MKDWLQLIGLGIFTAIIGFITIFFLAVISIITVAGPFVLVIWVVWKLFFS